MDPEILNKGKPNAVSQSIAVSGYKPELRSSV